ncbi:DUF5085 family protein [Paenibacillus sinopodophylli]|uniref:DUF5085 family protein n=1 Tax=Paenibacillus sinopodophylli TaxID=1837342 RepID=UPI00110D1DED|nr:DUF5085 family protein [Paenibacillus sinopodophylli]
MVLLGDSIRYTNVISKKYRYHYNEMNAIMESFVTDIIKINATVNGPLFYSINNVPMDEMVEAEFFMPVIENQVDVIEDMHFHSYFNIEDMITYCVYNEVETTTEIAYGYLLEYIKQNHLRQVTPIFHILSGDHSLQYVFIKIGIVPEEKKEPVWR